MPKCRSCGKQFQVIDTTVFCSDDCRLVWKKPKVERRYQAEVSAKMIHAGVKAWETCGNLPIHDQVAIILAAGLAGFELKTKPEIELTSDLAKERVKLWAKPNQFRKI